ncbi:MAG TPA: GAF domain-containing protein, partial [Anaerolineales bacterium]|nr:GAF domain-containing protein [Anaerolineales bacterium]
MKAFPSTPSRPILPRAPVIIAAALFIVALVIGLALLVGSVFLTQSIRSNIARSSQLLPRLSDLRAEVYSLHADTEAELNSELPRYVVLQARRQSVSDRLAEVRAVAPNTEEYQNTLQTVEDALQVFDLVITAFQNESPAPGREIALLFEMRRSFQTAESELAAIYDNEETNYLVVTANTTAAAGYLLVALLVVGFMIIVLGGALAFTIRQAARRETVLASGRLQVAAEVGAAAASLLSLETLFDTTLNLINQRFGYYYAAIFLLDEKGEYAILRAATGQIGANLIAGGHKALVGSNSTIGYVTFNNRPRVYSESQRQTEYFKSELIASTLSELAVPLRQANRVIGVLDVQSTEADPFTNDDIAILQTLADQIAVAIGNAAEFTREQERARQLATLTQASTELTGPQISFNSLLESIVQQSQQLIPADDTGVWLPAEDMLELKVSVSQPDQVGRRLLKTEGVSGQVFTTGRPLRIDDYARWSGRSRSAASAGIQSAMAVPLMWQGDSIGALSLTRSQINRPFTADDERMARLFASQAAAAIQNVQLLQETQDRVNELYTLNQIGQAIAAQTELRALFEVVRQEVMRAIRTKTFYIALYDAATQLVEMPYSFADGEVTSIPSFPLGPGLTSVVIKNRQPLLIRTAEEATAFGAFVSGDPSRSYLGVPILQRDEVMGVLAVQDQEKQNA